MTTTATLAPELTLRLEWLSRSTDIRKQAVARAARPDYPDWLEHVRSAAACTRPIRLAGSIATVENGTGRILSETPTAGMPDGIIYTPCGNRREAVCAYCSERYKRDAYQVVRTGLIGGKGVPEQVATHPAVFPTFTAPSFGEVHTRYVVRHTCRDKRRCDCRPTPCHARRDPVTCPHGVRLVCFARHDTDDHRLGTPLCADCYDYDAHVVWNIMSGELWRRTTMAIHRGLKRLANARGIPDVEVVTFSDSGMRIRYVSPVRASFGKAAEMQRRAVIHFHAILRLDGFDPTRKERNPPPPDCIDAADLVAVVEEAARTVAFITPAHPAKPEGWRIAWGEQIDVKPITVAANGEVTDNQVAGYLSKYATKATEVTGHSSGRITDDTIEMYSDPDGTHAERLIEACWNIGLPREWRRLRRWAHMLGFGGHFLTKSRTYSVTFGQLRQARTDYVRQLTTGPQQPGRPPEEPKTLVVPLLQFVGVGWHTSADAILANSSAALAREHQELARQYLAATAA